MVDAEQIAVSADDGVVTLRGTVGSLPQKIAASDDAKLVYGVRKVENQLEVRPVIGEQHDDAELRARVLQSLMLDSLVPSTIDAKAKAGSVTLTGRCNWQFERLEAERVAGNVPGVTGVKSEIELVPGARADDVQENIEESFERLADVDADNLSVKTSGGKVTLSGTVRSWAARNAAIDAAWWAPGVTQVEDHIEVRY
jgi:osmotically-inducible protein OsmY